MSDDSDSDSSSEFVKVSQFEGYKVCPKETTFKICAKSKNMGKLKFQYTLNTGQPLPHSLVYDGRL